MRIVVTIFFVVFSFCGAKSQIDLEPQSAIQFSGVVVTEDDLGEPQPLPYVNISVKGTSRGTYSDVNGFFSIVALTGDTIVFSSIGFKDIDKVIPDSLDRDRYTWYQIMSQDSILLPEAVIFPWPSREHFKYDFLAIDITDELRAQAEVNVAKEVLEEIRHVIPADGAETYNLVLNRNIEDYRYSGQYKPQNIFNPIAWKKFIDAWRRGDYKRKKKKKKTY